MITFFRNLPAGQAGIRQKLIAENRVTRFIAFAVGDIFLASIRFLRG